MNPKSKIIQLVPHDLACRMLNAIGWDGNNCRLRDPVSLAIASEVARINKKALEGAKVSSLGAKKVCPSQCKFWVVDIVSNPLKCLRGEDCKHRVAGEKETTKGE